MKLLIYSVLPSPYQRDLLCALAARPGVALRVAYAEAAAPDSPWPTAELEPWETVLPGICFGCGNVRVKWNRSVPFPEPGEHAVVNLDLTSPTTQRLMRALPRQGWVFWGERLRQQTVPWRRAVSEFLTRPLRFARTLVGVGQRAAEDYGRRFPEVPVASVPYHCDLTPFLALPERAVADEVEFLFCGQMIRRKGLDLLLEAFARLVWDGAPVRLRLVGREAELPELLGELPEGVRQRIVNEGFQPPAALPQFFGRAGVFVLPSRYEGWGVVVNQAIGAGLPVLCSDAVGAGELVSPGRNGWHFAADDADALFRAMGNCVELRGRLPAMGRASRAAAAGWTPQAGAEKWVRVLEGQG